MGGSLWNHVCHTEPILWAIVLQLFYLPTLSQQKPTVTSWLKNDLNSFEVKLPTRLTGCGAVSVGNAGDIDVFGGVTTVDRQNVSRDLFKIDSKADLLLHRTSNFFSQSFIVYNSYTTVKTTDVYIVGADSGYGNIYRLDISQATYKFIANPVTKTPTPVRNPCVVNNSTHLFVLGGVDNSTIVQSKVQIYNITGNTWSSDVPTMGTPRSEFSCALVNNKIFVFGGVTNSGTTDSNEVSELISNGTMQFALLKGAGVLSNPRARTSAVVFKDSVFVIGGHEIDSQNNIKKSYADVDKMDPSSFQVSKDTPLTTPRGGAAAVLFQGKIVVLGGMNCGSRGCEVLDSVEASNIQGSTETQALNAVILGVIIAAAAIACCIFLLIFINCTLRCTSSSTKRKASFEITAAHDHYTTHDDSSSHKSASQLNLNKGEHEVYSWLKYTVHLPQYSQNFFENGYTSLAAVATLRGEDELKRIGISRTGHRAAILNIVEEMNRQHENYEVEIPSPSPQPAPPSQPRVVYDDRQYQQPYEQPPQYNKSKVVVSVVDDNSFDDYDFAAVQIRKSTAESSIVPGQQPGGQGMAAVPPPAFGGPLLKHDPELEEAGRESSSEEMYNPEGGEGEGERGEGRTGGRDTIQF